MNWYRFLQTLTAIGALFIAIGIVALIFGALDAREARGMADWPATPGTITASETYSEMFRGRTLRFEDAVRITYSYSVDGEIFFSERVGVETMPVEADREEGQRRLQVYPVGATVTVFYDPADPATAVLERDTPRSGFAAATRLFVAGLAVLGLRWLLRKRPYQAGSDE